MPDDRKPRQRIKQLYFTAKVTGKDTFQILEGIAGINEFDKMVKDEEFLTRHDLKTGDQLRILMARQEPAVKINYEIRKVINNSDGGMIEVPAPDSQETADDGDGSSDPNPDSTKTQPTGGTTAKAKTTPVPDPPPIDESILEDAQPPANGKPAFDKEQSFSNGPEAPEEPLSIAAGDAPLKPADGINLGGDSPWPDDPIED